MRVGIPREIGLGERRVAATPETTKRLLKLGFDVVVERGAGELASFQDSDFEAAGASIAEDAKEIWSSDVVLKVRPPEAHADGTHEADLIREDSPSRERGAEGEESRVELVRVEVYLRVEQRRAELGNTVRRATLG